MEGVDGPEGWPSGQVLLQHIQVRPAAPRTEGFPEIPPLFFPDDSRSCG